MEQLKSPPNVGDQNKETYSANTELITNYEFSNTGIWIRGNNEKGYFATLGDRRVSRIYKTPLQLEDQLNGIDWEIILNVIVTITETAVKVSKEQKEKTES